MTAIIGRGRHLGWVALLLASTAYGQVAPLTPIPASTVPGKGSYTVANGAKIATPTGDTGAAAAARVLAAHVKTERGLALSLGGDTGAIRFERDPAIAGAEAYRLTVDSRGVRIAASGDAGLVYGAMTLAQLASTDAAFGKPARIAAVTIDDAPRFAWRGLLVDVARHFQPIEFLQTLIDQMASVKLNTLHLHLTDDQGWRFEVKRYPKLTEIGSRRTPPSAGGAPGPDVGGFYTQDQLKALVAYAAERGVTIVPEIDLPGHATALVAAYPELGVLGDRPPVSNHWGIDPYLFNPGPQGIAFVKEVLDELMAVFPGTYIHLGGDEAVKDQWQRSPEVQAQIKALGVKDENALQSWMIDQFGAYLEQHGRRLIGWDEILEGGVPASASVMSWRGEKGAIEAANKGHDVVLSPAPILYLDNLQADSGDEPPGRLNVQSLAMVYGYEPMPAAIAADKAHHVLGAQGNAWSEYLVTSYQVQHAIFPRAAAIAEMTWSAKGKRDFGDFVTRLQPQIRRWRRSGIEVADSAFAVDYKLQGSRGDALRANKVQVALASQTGFGTIRYTLDGKAPTATSRAYTAPLTVKPGTTILAAAFDAAGAPVAAPRRFDSSAAALLTRTSATMAPCPVGSPLMLRVPLNPDATTGPAFSVNIFNTCSIYPQAPMDLATGFTVDVARLPRNWALAHDYGAVQRTYSVTPYGELVVTARCQSKDKATPPVAIAAFPLPDPATAPQQFRFTGTLPKLAGDEDLCFQFTSPISDPFYAVDRVVLTEDAR
ncbi:beta-N-acetylhexosaminidase [Sphingomonas sp. RS6]